MLSSRTNVTHSVEQLLPFNGAGYYLVDVPFKTSTAINKRIEGGGE
jgi:hypothetical protein